MNNFLIAGFLIFSFISTAFAEEPPWEFRFKKEGISVYTRMLSSGLLEFKSDVVMTVPIDGVVAFYENTKNTPKWYYQCTHMELIKDEGPLAKIFYFVMDPPWPVSERDAVFRRIKSVDQSTGVVTYQLTAVPDAFPRQKGRVRVPSLSLVWHFTPVDQGHTDVYFQQHGEAGGYIPSFVANALVVDTPLNSLKLFKQMVEKKESVIQQARPKQKVIQVDGQSISEYLIEFPKRSTHTVQIIVLFILGLIACILGLYIYQRE